jgi:Transposase DDE domain group 1
MRPPSVEIVLEPLVGHTRYAPLAVLGYWLRRTKFLAPLWTPLDWSIKTYMHTPVDKLETLLVSLLAGNRAVYQINTTIRPDFALAQAWGQAQFAEQSTVAETLNHVCEADVTQLQQGSASLLHRHSRSLQHPFDTHWLLVDYDTTGLLISKRAEGSQKGYFSGHPNRYGRQLVRLSAPSYHETLSSALYAGNTHAFATLKQTVATFEQLLPQAQQHRSQIIFRSDAGIGTDANINWLLWRGYHVLTKGFSQTRAAAQARLVAPGAWRQDSDADRWIAPAPRPPRFGRHTEMYLVRWQTQQGFRVQYADQ